MSKKKKLNKLDSYHWHEALHTTHVIQMLIQRELLEHPVGEYSPKKIKRYLTKAQGYLEVYYQYCGMKQEDKNE